MSARSSAQVRARLAQVCLCLVIGVLAAAVIAWTFWLRAEGPSRTWEQVEAAERWPVTVPAGWPAPAEQWVRRHAGCTFQQVQTGAFSPNLHGHWADRQSGWGYQVLVERCGWPMRCLQGSIVRDNTPDRTWQRAGYLPAPVSLQHWGEVLELPARPEVVGLTLNSLLYGASVWFGFFGWKDVRQWRRVRRGLCGQCAYPMGVSARCTECGAELAHGPAAGL